MNDARNPLEFELKSGSATLRGELAGEGEAVVLLHGLTATRRYVVMGFNYQREVKEMVHDFGHRAESILAWQFGSQNFLQQLYSVGGSSGSNVPTLSTPANEYEQWLLVNGTVHRKPGGPDYGQDELAWVSALKPEWFPPAIDPNKVK